MLRIIPVGAKNGVNTAYVLPQTPVAGAVTFVVLEGQHIEQVASAPASYQCVLSGAALTMGVAPSADNDFAVYIQTNASSGLVKISLTGAQNGSNATFTLSEAPPAGSSLLFYANGLLLNQVSSAPTPSQMVLSGLTVTMGFAPASTDHLAAYIEKAFSYVLLQKMPMTGAGTVWTTPLTAISEFTPLLMTFVNGKLQQEVTTPPVSEQFTHTESATTVTITLGLSLGTKDSLEVYIIGLAANAAVVVVPTPSLPLYLTLQNELLVLMNERIDKEEAKMCLNRRWQKLLNAWSWSFTKGDGVFVTKAPQSAGTVAVTQGTSFAIGTNTPFVVADVGAMLVIGSDSYRVTAIQSLGPTQQLVRFDAPFIGTSNAVATYRMYYCVYALDADVVDILSMKGPTCPYEELTQEELDVRDIDRSVTGQPSHYVRRGMLNGIYQIELWPVPDTQHIVRYAGLLRSALTQRGQFIPDIAETLLMSAQEMACGIVASKCAAKEPPDYQGASFWTSKGESCLTRYANSLQELKSADRHRFGQTAHRGFIFE